MFTTNTPRRPSRYTKPNRRSRLRMEPLELRAVPATIAWDGGPTGQGTSWLDPVNWIGDVLPGANDDAVINTTGTGQPATVILTGSATVQNVSVAVGASLTLASATLRAYGISNSGSLTTAGGGVTIGAPTPPPLGGPMFFGNSGTMTITTNTDISEVAGTYGNSGTITTVGPQGRLSCYSLSGVSTNTGTINVTAGSSAEFRADASVGNGTFSNQGTINVAGSFYATRLQNYASGTGMLTGGTYNISGSFDFGIRGGIFPPPPIPVVRTLNADVTFDGPSASLNRPDGFALTAITAASHLSVKNLATATLSQQVVNAGAVTLENGGRIVLRYPFGGNFINQGTFSGSGLLANYLTNDGGTVSPGLSTGIISLLGRFSNYGPTADGTLVVDLNGRSPGVDYDQIVMPDAQLGGQLVVHAGYAATPGDTFRIIDYSSPGHIIGAFAGLPEGATLTANGQQFRISYVGGDGNDVTLTREPVPPTFRWDGRPDSGGTSSDNHWSTDSNWVGDIAPTAGANLVFPIGAAQLANVNDFPAGTVFSLMSVIGSGYVISGNAADFTAGVTADIASGSSTLLLHVGGVGGQTKGGSGTLILSGANTFTGVTTVSGGFLDLAQADGLVSVLGNLVVNGGIARELFGNQIGDTSNIAVNPGGTFNLNGQSDTVGAFTVVGGIVQTNGGRLNAGNESLDANSTLSMNLVDGTSSDRITVNGTVALGGTLQLALGAPVTFGTEITLIDNDGMDAVSGSFSNAAEGAIITVGGSPFRITYNGGTDQNDVVITAINPSSGQIAGTVFTDINGNGQNNSDPTRDGVTVQLDIGADGTVDQTTTTANGGLYAFSDLPAARFRIRIAAPTGTLQTSPNPGDVTLAIAQMVGGVDFGVFQLVSISGTKFNDRNGDGVRNNNEPGVGGVEMRIFPSGGGPIIQTAMSNPDGTFTFSNIGPGTFDVQEVPPDGTTQTTPDPAAITTSSGTNVMGLLFGNQTNRVELFAVGEGAGGAPNVNVYNSDGSLRYNLLAYNSRFAGGVRVATGDVNGDGIDDIVTAPGPGGGPHIQVIDGATSNLLQSFLAYSPSFTGGVFVAAGDVNNDGFADIITGAGTGGGPHVEVFSGINHALLKSFFAYSPNFAGGVRVAAGDVNGDQFADIITGAGTGGGPHVEVFSGTNLSLLKSFIAFDPSFTGGVYVAAGDVNSDGHADVIVGAGEGGGPHVKVFDGTNGALIKSFFAYDPNFRGGVRVAVGDMNGDGKADIMTGAGVSGGPHVKVFDVASLAALDSFLAFDPAFLGGVFVG